MTTEEFIKRRLHTIKHTPVSQRLRIPVLDSEQRVLADLVLIVAGQERDDKVINKCSVWRKTHEWWFPKQFHVTHEGTRRWLRGVIESEDRVLFLISQDGAYVGHIGLYRFDYVLNSCELDNVLRGEIASRGIMTFAASALMEWAKKEFRLKKMTLRVFSDNIRAIRLYSRIGFRKTGIVPLVRKSGDNETEWIEDKLSQCKAEREYTIMEYRFAHP